MTLRATYVNGKTATADDLAPLAFAGYAHFTAMQVVDGGVRGLDLHLDRLRHGSDVLFGAHLPDDVIVEFLRAAVHDASAAHGPDASLSCYVTSRPGEFAASASAPALDVVIKVGDPAQPPAGPLALDLVRHQRHLAGVKHVGEVAKTLYLRRARERGFDDAAFVDTDGRLAEATIWNLAFRAGDGTIVWPEADVLPGVTMQIVRRRLAESGAPQVTRAVSDGDVAGMSAVVLNSWTPAVPLSRLGDQRLEPADELTTLLHEAYRSEPLRPL
ncbi:branched-chain amino acid aminotransferase [Saccharomonospora sp. CUA-673]|uniref:aminotransferase class IV n=1 Tax=Saccharomonospora sp. CUA-673 TaxID=1904969 RepID=UPI0009639626|nr:aminotransferase class IV [Saccharomonospora sp. CUA-673]OLT46957.1 branched-chain amino acid aminotransferase [Saccharomonospora sp. CUA-673]